MDYEKELRFAQAIIGEILPDNAMIDKTRKTWDEPSREMIESNLLSWIGQSKYQELRIDPETGSDDKAFFIAVHFIDAFSPKQDCAIPTLRLFSIWIPEDLRRQGLCSSILDTLELYSKEKDLQFLVGPVIEEAMTTLLIKKKYTRRTVLDFIK